MSKFIDLTGQRFGKITVIKRVANDKDNHAYFLCRCDCGNEKIILGRSLRNGSTRSCGCKTDLIGMRFGRLVVVKEVVPIESIGEKRKAYLCRCDCGKSKVIRATSLPVKNGTKSCGCLIKETHTKYNSIPEKTQNRLYWVWSDIKTRCYNKNSVRYKDYGGRGIKICDEWLDFQNFYEWAMTNGYKEEMLPSGRNRLTIDRIDVNGNYCPENCRWVTQKEQTNNTRVNHYLEFNGKKQTLSEWGEEVGISVSTLAQRINHLGWSIERALTTPTGNKKCASSK